MRGFVGDIESLAKDNIFFRQVIYTAPHSQLVLMSLKPGEEIGKRFTVWTNFSELKPGKARRFWMELNMP